MNYLYEFDWLYYSAWLRATDTQKMKVRSYSAHLHIVEIYGESCEWLCQGFVSSWQSAQSLCSIRLHRVIGQRGAAHWTTELPSWSHGQTAHLWHTKPETKNRNVILGPDTLCCCLKRVNHFSEQTWINYLWCRRISGHSIAIPNTVAPAGMTRPVADGSLNSVSPLFGTRNKCIFNDSSTNSTWKLIAYTEFIINQAHYCPIMCLKCKSHPKKQFKSSWSECKLS